MHRHTKVIALVSCLLIALLCVSVVVITETLATDSEHAYRPVNKALAIRQSRGWKIASAPTDNLRYRTCGSSETGPDFVGDHFLGSFSVGDRSVTFDVQIPAGQQVAVEGLEPLNGGPLTYAVLTRHQAQ